MRCGLFPRPGVGQVEVGAGASQWVEEADGAFQAREKAASSRQQ